MNIQYYTIAAYLNGTASHTEREEVERWVNSSADNRRTFEELTRIWQRTGDLRVEEPVDAEQSWQRFTRLAQSTEVSRRSVVSWWSWVGKAAAALLLLVSLSYLGWRLWQPDYQHVVTQSQSKSDILLPDGTRVWLNQFSSLNYPQQFDDNERFIELTGEGFFEVEKDPDRPFIIKTGDSEVKVLGTSFNVRNSEEQTEVVVVTGKVAFYGTQSDTDTLLLQPQDKGTYHLLSHRLIKSKNADPNVLSWKTGRLVFDNTPLVKAIATLERHYQQKITLDNEGSGCGVSTEFENRSLEEVLEELTLMLGATYQKSADGYLLSVPGCR